MRTQSKHMFTVQVSIIFFILHLIGWENGAKVFEHLQSVLKQNQSDLD